VLQRVVAHVEHKLRAAVQLLHTRASIARWRIDRWLVLPHAVGERTFAEVPEVEL
jgi:hypothetical protein